MRRDKIDNARMFSDAMYGLAIGDAVGMSYNKLIDGNKYTNNNSLFAKYYSSYTSSAIITLNSILSLRYKYENIDINKIRETNIQTNIIPVCLYGIWLYEKRENINDIINYICNFARLCGANEDDVALCVVYYYIIKHVLYDYFDLYTRIENGIADAYNFCLNNGFLGIGLLDKIRKSYKNRKPYVGKNSYAKSLLTAITYLNETNNYRQCITKVVRETCGDNLISSIAGSIAGIEYGEYAIPAEWKYNLSNWVNLDDLCENANKKMEVIL